METGKAIYSILSDASLTGAATVHPEIAPESTDFPFVVYSIQNIEPSHQKESTSTMDDSTLEVYAMSQSYSECMDLATECRAALDRNAGTFAGVEVQSIEFETAEIAYNQVQECYMVEQTYSVRILRVGSAPAAALLPLNASSVFIKETDGTPSAQCSELKFPAGTLTIDTSAGAGLGVANYAPVWEYSRFNANPVQLEDATQTRVDFTSQTPQNLEFTRTTITTGTNITTNAGGMISSSVAGYYRLNAELTFSTDSTGHSMRFYFMVHTSKQEGEGVANIKGVNTSTKQAARLNVIVYLQQGERVSVWAYDDTNSAFAVYVSSAWIDVERLS